jgi:tRNA nucleotidyltransferase (CCA-adding enzyme)
MNLSSLRYDYGVMNAENMEGLAVFLESAGPHTVAEQLHASLPAVQLRLLKTIAEAAESQSAAIYLVGGPVRDLMLAAAIKDFDLVIEGRALSLAKDLKESFGGEITEHKRFGTAKWKTAEIKQKLAGQLGPGLPADELPDSVDLISARKEMYTQPGALPKVEFADIEGDTQRRDFSLNTLAIRLDGEHFGELLDLWGGLDDLAAGQLRVLHEKSFIDDPTRILRIHRFGTRLGFMIEKETQALLKSGLSGLSQISGERIRNELDLFLSEPTGIEALDQMQQEGILESIHPELHFDAQMANALRKLPDTLPDNEWELDGVNRLDLAYALWLGKLSEQSAMDVAERLRFDNGLTRAIREVSQQGQEISKLAGAKASEAVALLEKLSPLARYAIYVDTGDESIKQLMLSYAESWRKVRPTTDGAELLRRGLPEGPLYKEILAALRAAWLNGDVSSNSEEKKYLETLLNESRQ